MLEDDDLAQYAEVTGLQLEGVSCILFERHVHPPFYDALRSATKAASKPGTSDNHVMTARRLLIFVSRGFGFAVWPRPELRGSLKMESRSDLMNVAGIGLETRLACRVDSQVRVVGEFLRGFVKRLKEHASAKQLRLGLAG